MASKTIILALAVLLIAAVCTFVGVYFGVGRQKQDQVFFKAAVAADAGPCSDIGRWELKHWNISEVKHIAPTEINKNGPCIATSTPKMKPKYHRYKRCHLKLCCHLESERAKYSWERELRSWVPAHTPVCPDCKESTAVKRDVFFYSFLWHQINN